jgi:cardiolipin synthase
MGLANWLTVLRILLIPVFVTLLVYRQRGPALTIFLVAAFTDLLDGYVARQRGSQSRLGAFLDPMADKLLMVCSFVTLTWLKALPFWIAAVVISRDLILMVGALAIHMAGGRITPRPTRAGKLATFCQVLTVLAGLLMPFYQMPLLMKTVLWATAAFTVFSGLQYIVQGMRFLNAVHADEARERDESTLYR